MPNKKNRRRSKTLKPTTVKGILTLSILSILILSCWIEKANKMLTPQPDNLRVKQLEFWNTSISQRQTLIANKVSVCQLPASKPVKQTIVKKSSNLSSGKYNAEIEAKVKQVFDKEPEIMLATLKAESGLNPKAQGWNCRYGDRVKACKPQDRGKAISTDCGIVQNNFPGKVCPDYAFDIEWSLKEGKRKYDTNEKIKAGTGKHRWFAFLNGSYKKYL